MSELPDLSREAMLKRAEERLKDLEKRSKPLQELIVSEDFVVKEAISTSNSTSIRPRSEMVLGGTSGEYAGSYTTYLVLKVNSLNPNSPIRELIFQGYSPVRAGEIVTARIPLYKTKRVTGKLHGPGHRNRTFYFEREPSESEEATELAIHSPNNDQITRRDRSTIYF